MSGSAVFAGDVGDVIAIACDVLQAYGMAEARLTPVTHGHINRTFTADGAWGRRIVQRLNPIFSAAIHHDIHAVTRRLKMAGVMTPELIATPGGDLWVEDAAGFAWRVFTFVSGRVYLRAASPLLCASAGQLAARFHGALASFSHAFAAPRLGVHDTGRHCERLRVALVEHGDHRAVDRVAPLAERLLQRLDGLAGFPSMPEQIVHGDMKLSNVIFADTGEALAFVDLDTLTRMPLVVELGDALRSWCAEGGEDAAVVDFSLPHFEAALRGYHQGGRALLRPEDVVLLPLAVERITLELGVRFAADALRESYFAWDRQRFGAAWEHNLLRAQSQLSLADALAAKRREAERLIAEVF